MDKVMFQKEIFFRIIEIIRIVVIYHKNTDRMSTRSCTDCFPALARPSRPGNLDTPEAPRQKPGDRGNLDSSDKMFRTV